MSGGAGVQCHCFHDVVEDFVKAVHVYPPRYQQVCCWCGATRMRCYDECHDGHGEYLPRPELRERYTEPDRECIKRGRAA